MNFDENVSFLKKCMILCVPPIAFLSLRCEQVVPDVSASRFPTRTHALDALQPLHNRFDNFYFSLKNLIFQDFQGFSGNLWFGPLSVHPGWSAAARFVSGPMSSGGGGIGPWSRIGGSEAVSTRGMSPLMSPVPAVVCGAVQTQKRNVSFCCMFLFFRKALYL